MKENLIGQCRVAVAANEYILRQARVSHPLGRFDRGGRWYPNQGEKQACCDTIRYPSRRWPYSLMKHCRTAQHISMLCGVNLKSLRQATRLLKQHEHIFANSRDAELFNQSSATTTEQLRETLRLLGNAGIHQENHRTDLLSKPAATAPLESL